MAGNMGSGIRWAGDDTEKERGRLAVAQGGLSSMISYYFWGTDADVGSTNFAVDTQARGFSGTLFGTCPNVGHALGRLE